MYRTLKQIMEQMPEEQAKWIETESRCIYTFRKRGAKQAEEQHKWVLRGFIRCMMMQNQITVSEGQRLWTLYAQDKKWEDNEVSVFETIV